MENIKSLQQKEQTKLDKQKKDERKAYNKLARIFQSMEELAIEMEKVLERRLEERN